LRGVVEEIGEELNSKGWEAGFMPGSSSAGTVRRRIRRKDRATASPEHFKTTSDEGGL